MSKLSYSLTLATFLLVLATAAGAQAPQRLFEISSTAAPAKERSSLASVREADISFGPASLAESGRERIEILLFDGKAYEARRKDVEIRAIDDYTWRGSIEAKSFTGDVILTFRKGYVSGLIYSPEAVYEIIASGSRQILVELDQALFPECGGDVQVPADEMKQDAAPQATIDSGDRIDVMVVYTTATKNAVGGDAQAQTLAQQAIDASNTTYINSGVRQRLRMVHATEYVFVETGNSSADLSTLRNNATVQALRNTHNADLVAMIGEVSDVCGIGYLSGTPGGSEFGYTITARSCAVGNLSFAHELGHNMGSQHNPENGSGGFAPYSYGHYVNGVFRTVMSYTNPCPSGCTRRPYFSNPDVYYNGLATGIFNARDNARSLNETADNMANYRYSGSSIQMSNLNGFRAEIPRGIRRTLQWTSDNISGNVNIQVSRDEGLSWQTIVAGTPNDGSEPITVSGRTTRRARIRIASVAAPHVTDSSNFNIYIR